MAAVARAYKVPAARIFEREHPQAYRAAVYLLRRAANLPLAEVAQRAGVSPGRISQIQSQIEREAESATLARLLRSYILKA